MKLPLPRALPLPLVVAASLAGVAGIGILDVTGVEVRILPLYFVPVAFGAWYARGAWAWLLVPLCGVAWVVSNVLVGHRYSAPLASSIDGATQIVACAFVALLVAQLRRRLDLEERLGRSDSLTALPNRRAFHERAEWMLAQARRHGLALTLAYLDLDSFKTVGDRYGQQQTNDVLREIGAILKEHTRASDVVARVCGDEFVIMIANTNPDGAQIFLQRLRVMIAGAMSRRGWPVTVSIGAASFERPPASVDGAISRSIALMYAAKEAGGNQVYLEVGEAPNAVVSAAAPVHSYS